MAKIVPLLMQSTWNNKMAWMILEVEKLLIMWITRSEAVNPHGSKPSDDCRKGSVSLSNTQR